MYFASCLHDCFATRQRWFQQQRHKTLTNRVLATREGTPLSKNNEEEYLSAGFAQSLDECLQLCLSQFLRPLELHYFYLLVLCVWIEFGLWAFLLPILQ